MYDYISGFSDEICADVKTQFKALNKLGIKYFEPRGINGKNISELSAAEVTDLKRLMDEYGISASSIGSPVGKTKLSEDFAAHFEMFKGVVENANALGAKYIRIFSFYHDGGEWTEEERAEVIKRLKKMSAYAAENGVVLLHENEKGIYGDTAARCADIMRELYSDSFKAVFDPANFVQCGEDTKNAYNLMQDYIEYIHIKDAKNSDGTVVPAGMGDGNVEWLMKQLFENGYHGFLSLEPHLGSFEGLNALENGDIMKNLPEGGEGTFTLAFNALNKILENVGGEVWIK